MNPARALPAIDAPPGVKPNPGYCPAEAEGKRVRVQLVHGGIDKCDDARRGGPPMAAKAEEIEPGTYDPTRPGTLLYPALEEELARLPPATWSSTKRRGSAEPRIRRSGCFARSTRPPACRRG